MSMSMSMAFERLRELVAKNDKDRLDINAWLDKQSLASLKRIFEEDIDRVSNLAAVIRIRRMNKAWMAKQRKKQQEEWTRQNDNRRIDSPINH